jgi:hypothetical protein
MPPVPLRESDEFVEAMLAPSAAGDDAEEVPPPVLAQADNVLNPAADVVGLAQRPISLANEASGESQEAAPSSRGASLFSERPSRRMIRCPACGTSVAIRRSTPCRGLGCTELLHPHQYAAASSGSTPVSCSTAMVLYDSRSTLAPRLTSDPTPLSLDNATGRWVLVSAQTWNSEDGYVCNEHNGQGWEAQVLNVRLTDPNASAISERPPEHGDTFAGLPEELPAPMGPPAKRPRTAPERLEDNPHWKPSDSRERVHYHGNEAEARVKYVYARTEGKEWEPHWIPLSMLEPL